MLGWIRARGWLDMTLVEQVGKQADVDLGPNRLHILRRRVLSHPGLLIGAATIALIALAALLAPIIAPHDPYLQNLSQRFTPPVWHVRGTWEHVLGADHLGRDYLSRLLYGAQISLAIGISAAFVSGVIGTVLGVSAGYFGGRVDLIVNYLITVRLAMPVVLVALAVVAIFGGSLIVVISVLGLLLWDRYAVVMRASTIQIRNLEYVQSATAIGCSMKRIILTEILPNVFNNLVVVATLEMAHAILLEAALSFLGMGVQPPLPSWGLMVSEGKDMLFFQAWLITIPGLALFVLILAINMLGDGIRDVTAPGGKN